MATKIKPAIKHFVGYSFLFIAYLFVLASLITHTPTSFHPSADAPANGQVQIKVPIHNADYIIVDEKTNSLMRHYLGGTETFELPAGTYRVEFAQVPGHSTPDPLTFNLPAGERMRMEGDYRLNCGGPLLGIKIFPEYAHYTIYNRRGEKLTEAKGSQFFTYPAGDYWVEFDELPDYQRPPKQPFRLLNKIVTTINAIYNKK